MSAQREFGPEVAEFLSACSQQYDALLEASGEIRAHGNPEAILDWVKTVAAFAAMHHPGRFADGALENLALEVGRQLDRTASPPLWLESLVAQRARSAPAKRRVLHVATTMLNIGGHTRTILNWIRKDPGSEHSLVTTSSAGVQISPVVMEAIAESGGQLYVLPDESPLLSRARWLREFSRRSADLVFLHLVPYDVVPVVAFAESGGPPVALINLADQCFWLGSTVADSVVHLREIGATTSRDIRFTRNDLLLPIPLFEARAELSKADARRELGIPESQIVLLTIGRGIKFAPSARHNFFRTGREILDRNPAAHLYVVGVRAADHAQSPEFVAHDRMHFLGPLNDPTAYQRAADVYLEGFPFGSQTALLETALAGTACVPAFAPATALLATHDFALTGTVDNPADEPGYVARVGEYAADREKRVAIARTLRERVLHFHVLESWNGMLDQVYGALEKLRHDALPLPNAKGAARHIDLAISEYHATRANGADVRTFVDGEVRGLMRFASYTMRQRGFHADSFRLLRFANRNQVWDRESVGYAIKLLPHWLVHAARRFMKRQDDTCREIS
ncbi:MAG: hypothetical protein WDO72_02835 [Pseudomonadota bacterium]